MKNKTLDIYQSPYNSDNLCDLLLIIVILIIKNNSRKLKIHFNHLGVV